MPAIRPYAGSCFGRLVDFEVAVMRHKLAGSFLTSLVLHGSSLAAGAWLLSRSLGSDATLATARLESVEVELSSTPGLELPRMSRSGLSGAPDPAARPEPDLVLPGGGERLPRPDMPASGRGGSDRSAEAALNLADSNDGLTLDRDPMNRFDRSQVQRLKTSLERRSLDDRRATPNPMQLAFLATGEGTLLERRPADRNPSNGSFSAQRAASEGGLLGGAEFDSEPGRGGEPEPGTTRRGTVAERSGPGVPTAARGSDFRFSAAVALARPWVPEARAAVPAPERGRPNDTIDSSQDVASAVASLVHASNAGARQRGEGPGGETAPGAPGSGGPSGAGSRALRSGSGLGPARDTGNDARLGAWRAGLLNRLGRWDSDFPDWARLAGRGGIAIIAATMFEDGTVSDVRVVRSSGVDEFDRKLVARVRRAVPFEPPPAVLGRRALPINFKFDALNPVVGRQGPGRGRARQ